MVIVFAAVCWPNMAFPQDTTEPRPVDDDAGARKNNLPAGPEGELHLLSPANTPESSFTEKSSRSDSIAAWIEKLGSPRFAVRERAADELLMIGSAALPALRSCQQRTSDAEVLIRIEKLVERLSNGDFESRVKRFLAGDDSEMKNWAVIRILFGETIRVRELYVDLLREYPVVIESLIGNADQLTQVTKIVNARLDQKRIGIRAMPSQTDLVAALLPASDPKVRLTPEYESRLLAMINVHTANELRRDHFLGGSFTRLVAAWMRRSDPRLRQEVLRLAMRWDMTTALDLAKKSLQPNADPELLATCFQVISRFGDNGDAFSLVPYLDDKRTLLQPLYQRDADLVCVGDAAIAAIGVIHRVPLVDLGFEQPAEQRTFGFLFDKLSFPPGVPDAHSGALQRIQALIAKPKPSKADGS